MVRDSEGALRSLSCHLPSVHLPRRRLHTAFFVLNAKQETCEYQFFGLWFDSTLSFEKKTLYPRVADRYTLTYIYKIWLDWQALGLSS